MSTAPWHLDPDLARDYATGAVTPVLAASVEQHVTACGSCRAVLAGSADTERLDRVWGQVLTQVQAPRVSVLERLLRRAGMDPGTARLVAATPSLTTSWLSGVVIVLVLAVVAAHTDRPGAALFLALAPVLPLAGVAFAFGPAADPTHEVTAATPHSQVHLLAVRTAVVVVTTLAPTALVALLLPERGWLSVAWLLPALALTVGTIALSTRLLPHVAAGALAAVWLAVVAPGLVRPETSLTVDGVAVQLACLGGLVLSGLVLALGRDQLPETLRRTS